MRLRRRGVGIGASAALLATAFACRQIVGIGDEPPGSTTTQPDAQGDSLASQLDYTGACGRCLVDNCAAEGTRCLNATPCKDYMSCLGGCDGGDPQCRAQCGVDNIIGATYDPGVEITELRDCLAQSCAAPCSLDGCANIFSDYVSPPDAAPACESCFSAVCGTSASSDAGPPITDYQAGILARCLLACTTPDCTEACENGVIDGSTIVMLPGSCTIPCAWGGYWACAGKSWPDPSAASCSVVAPVGPNAVVSVCTNFNPSCVPPFAPSVSADDAGVARVSVQTGSASLPLFLRIGPAGDAGAADSGSAIVPALYYWTFPLTQARWDVPFGLITYDTLATLFVGVQSAAMPGRGQMYVLVSDCRGTPAPSVVVDLPGVLGVESGVARYYWDPAGVPATNLTETSSNSAVSLTNIPPGRVRVTATPKGFAQPVAQADVLVNADEITYVDLVPTLDESP